MSPLTKLLLGFADAIAQSRDMISYATPKKTLPSARLDAAVSFELSEFALQNFGGSLPQLRLLTKITVFSATHRTHHVPQSKTNRYDRLALAVPQRDNSD